MKKLISIAMVCAMSLQMISVAHAEETVYTITVPQETYQTVKGWGVYPNSVGSGFLNKAAAHKALYHELGITQFRIELRGQAGDGDGNLVPQYYNDFVSNIRLAANNGIEKYSVHIWSPPIEMKDNYKIGGRKDDGSPASLRPECEQKFCDWIVKAFKGLEENGLTLPMAISIQNEPEVLMEYQSCSYDSEQYIRVVKLLRKTFDNEGLNGIEIIGPEGGGYRSNTTWFGKEFNLLDSDPELVNAIGGFVSHSYPLKQGSPDSDLADYIAGCDKYPEKDRWQSEYCNGNSMADTQVARTILAISTMNSDMVWGRNNYWIWWLGFDERYSIDAAGQEVLLGGDGVSNVIKSAQFEVLSKIYNNVPVGAKVKKPVSDDPELKTTFSLTNDMAAYDSAKGATVVIINRGKESKHYDVTGLKGKSAIVSSVSNTFEGMKDIAQRNIEDGCAKNIILPPESVNVLTTHLSDVSAPNIDLDLSNYWKKDDSTYIIRDPEVVISGSVDEPSTVTVNRTNAKLDENLGFSYRFEVKKSAEIAIVACDKNKNYAEPIVLKFVYDPKFVGISFDEFPEKSNRHNVEVAGRMNAAGSIEIDGKSYATEENGEFRFEIPIEEGDNTVTIRAKDNKGNQSELKEYHIFCDTTAPELTVDETPESTNDFECILSGAINESGTVMVNGANISLREDNSFNIKYRLNEGKNSIEIKTVDEFGNETTVTKNITFIRDEKTPHETDAVSYTKQVNGSINIDGDLSEWTIDNKMTKVTTGTPNNIVNFSTMWNMQYLYVAAQITDDKICYENNTVYQNDAIELFLNPGNEKITQYMPNDKQLFVGYINNVTDLYRNSNSKCITAWKNTETGYSVEAAIPWLELGVDPSIGLKIGFDIACDDKDIAGNRESVLMWAGTNENWQDTSNFGTLILCGENDIIYIDKPNETQTAAEEPSSSDTIIHNDMVMVPVRATAESLGIKVVWNDETKQAVVGDYIIDPFGGYIIDKDSNMQSVEIYWQNDSIYLPIEAMNKITAQ